MSKSKVTSMNCVPNMGSPCSRRGALAILAVLCCTGPVLGAEPDALARPAIDSPRAAQSVMLAIARTQSRLIAVGERGIVVYSDNGGKTWQQAKVPVAVSLTNVYFADEKNGWIVGHAGVVLNSTDGGETWALQLDGRRAADLVLKAAQAKAVDGSEVSVRRLADAQRLVDDGPDKPFLTVYFETTKRGFIGGAFGLLLATDDGGVSWYPVSDRLDNPGGKHLYDIRRVGAAIYIVGEQGAVFRSTDHGLTFTTITTPYKGTFFGVTEAAAGGSVLLYGLRGNVLRSENGLQAWTHSESRTSNSISAGLLATDGSLILVDETGQVLRSTDDGRSFTSVALTGTMPFTGIIQKSDGEFVLSGARGTFRFSQKSFSK